jgi:hypothetical protein
MEKLEGRDCLLSACYYVATIATIVLQQLSSSIDQKIPTIAYKTSYNCCLLFVTHINF